MRDFGHRNASNAIRKWRAAHGVVCLSPEATVALPLDWGHGNLVVGSALRLYIRYRLHHSVPRVALAACVALSTGLGI
jgi:hypothetical protein